jgi:hypothetical protein
LSYSDFKKLALLMAILFRTTFMFAQFSHFSLPESRKNLSMSFSNYDNLVVVDLVLGDSIPVRLMLDSGVEGLIITDMEIASYFSDRCVRKFKLSAPGTLEVLEACVTRPVKVGMGKLLPMFSNLIILDEDYFSLDEYIGSKVHGLMGMEKFRNLVVTTDYDRNILRFRRPENYTPPAKSEIVPVSIIRGKPYMTSRVELDNGQIMDLWLMIDSGANHPLLLEFDSLTGYRPQKSIDAIIGKGLGGNLHGSFARVGWMMLGNFRLDDVITSFTDNYMPGNISNRLNRHGTLGSGALGRFKVTFDYSNNRMILEKGNKFRTPFEYNMSGLSFRAVGAGFNIFEVSEVIPSSPAAIAGIKAEDILISINGKSTFLLSLGDINRLLSLHEGSIINLVISREGKTMNFRFKLKKLI